MKKIKVGKLGKFESEKKEIKRTGVVYYLIKWDCAAIKTIINVQVSQNNINCAFRDYEGKGVSLHLSKIRKIEKLMNEFDPNFRFTGLDSVIRYVFLNYLYEEELV